MKFELESSRHDLRVPTRATVFRDLYSLALIVSFLILSPALAFQNPHPSFTSHLYHRTPPSSLTQPYEPRRISTINISVGKFAFLRSSLSTTESRFSNQPQLLHATTTRSRTALPLSSIAVIPPSTPINGDNLFSSKNKKESTSLVSDQSAEKSQKPRVGVLLLNLGGPERTEDVEGFLYNLFADPDIIQLPGPLAPLQPWIARFISQRRAPKSRQAYDSIGGGSPILKYSQEQARLIAQQVDAKFGLAVKTYIGMRYWHPFTEQALDEIQRDQIQALVIVPLYPQFSISTSGSSLRVLQEEFSQPYFATKYPNMIHTVVPSWYHRPGYVKAMVDLLMKQLNSFTDEELEAQRLANPDIKPKHVLFSAHGVPQSYIAAGDPYQMQMEECVEGISKNLPNDVQVHLSYQSRVGPIEWLRPYTDDVLPRLGQELHVKNLVVVPVSFVSEHIETLEEIDIEYRELAEECGIVNWRRCPALNTHPGFVNDMADLVYEALQEPIFTVTEACVANRVRDVELQPLDERLGINTAGVQGVGGDFPIFSSSGSASSTSSSPTTSFLNMEQERLIARLAMLGVVLTILWELFGQGGQALMPKFFLGV
ncbi:hypothetical protein ACA910_011749 [Epithemia clementina (nom. ined.)]